MSSTNDIRQTFFQECDELLEALNDGLSEIEECGEESNVDPETINAVFRAVHSIKGGSAAFGLDAIVGFAHKFENMLDDLRSERIIVTPSLTALCHRAADHLSYLVRTARDDVDLENDAGAEIVRKLAEACVSEEAEDEADGDYSFEPMALPFAAFEPEETGSAFWQITFRPEKGLIDSGNDPVHIFREISGLGTLRSQADIDRIPLLEELSPNELFVDWSLDLETDATEMEIQEVFDFVAGLCQLEVMRRNSVESQAFDASPVEIPAAMEEMSVPDLSGQGVAGVKPYPTHTAAGSQASTDPQESRSPSPVPEAEPAGPASQAESDGPSARAERRASPRGATVRVDLDLVDRLINMVGELVINQAMLTQLVQDAGLSDGGHLMTSLTDLRNLTSEIQENVMAIRAQPVKPLFQRMARIVREASDIAEKNTQFVTEGEMTEVDKTVIEQLVDPLTHMIRNAIDHGLEPAECRLKAGKPEIGTVTLSAAHRSGRVVIEVSDDGGGIDRQKVLAIARRKELIAPDIELSDNEIDNLLFLPGFSTASSVSSLSGRGVGMDVVKSAIRKLGGRVSITSEPGKGTTMSISLPLTLAVLDGMVVDVAGQTMVVPITAIVETMRPLTDGLHELGSDSLVVNVRDRLLPVIDLGRLFGHRLAKSNIVDMVLLLVETEAGETIALAVDRIYDQRQIVIKGLETNYGHVPCVAAATILGDGKIALIIDPEETAAMGRQGSATPNVEKEVQDADNDGK